MSNPARAGSGKRRVFAAFAVLTVGRRVCLGVRMDAENAYNLAIGSGVRGKVYPCTVTIQVPKVRR